MQNLKWGKIHDFHFIYIKCKTCEHAGKIVKSHCLAALHCECVRSVWVLVVYYRNWKKKKIKEPQNMEKIAFVFS